MEIFYPITIEGKIIASIIMVLDIAILGIFISAVGAMIIESRLKSKNTANTNKDRISR